MQYVQASMRSPAYYMQSFRSRTGLYSSADHYIPNIATARDTDIYRVSTHADPSVKKIFEFCQMR